MTQRSWLGAGLAVLVAWMLDSVGEPPVAWHPVVWYGKLIQRLEQASPRGNRAQLVYGGAMLVLAAPAALLPALLVCELARQARGVIGKRYGRMCGELTSALIEGSALKPFFALCMLADAGRAVRQPLERNDIPAARQALQSLVSRDRSQLTAEQMAAAAIESLGENLSDSVVAPLFYYALGGLPGAALYRLCNTFDSMVGYHGRYEYIGKAAARLDDLLNLFPARLTALLIILFAPLFGGTRRKAWAVWRRDARKTASPNAGHPMAALAGALDVQLEKVGHYTLGDNQKAPCPADIQRAERMVARIGSIAVILAALCRMYWSVHHE